jgi:hypothetical protein
MRTMLVFMTLSFEPLVATSNTSNNRRVKKLMTAIFSIVSLSPRDQSAVAHAAAIEASPEHSLRELVDEIPGDRRRDNLTVVRRVPVRCGAAPNPGPPKGLYVERPAGWMSRCPLSAIARRATPRA